MKFEMDMQDSNAQSPDPSEMGPSETLVGKLLVASTSMQDPVLNRAVCLVVHQDHENVIGVLLNRPMTPPPGLAKMLKTESEVPNAPLIEAPSQRYQASPGKPFYDISKTFRSQFATDDAPPPESDLTTDLTTYSLAQQAAAEASQALGKIHFGGPLSGPVVAVHNSRELAEVETGRGVYVAARKEILERLVQHRPASLRLIVGHLGWSTEQLATEREAGFWHVLDATEEDVFSGDQTIWPLVIRRATTASMTQWLGIKDVPFASEVN